MQSWSAQTSVYFIVSKRDWANSATSIESTEKACSLQFTRMPAYHDDMTMSPPSPVATMTCILSSFGGLIILAVSQPINKPAVMLQSRDSSQSLVNAKQQGEISLQLHQTDRQSHYLRAVLTGSGHQTARLWRSTDEASFVNVRLGTKT